MIIIDDFHLAAPEPAAMIAFVDALPSSVRLVLGTRHDPLVPARSHQSARSPARAAAGGPAVHERRDRAGDVQSSASSLEPTDLDHLARLTEGWAAGVHLAALSFEAGAAPDR